MMDTEALVCVVEDDAPLRASLTNLLRSVGLRVAAFASAQEFLRSPRPEGPSCLVLDVRLPGLSGLELQQQLVAGDLAMPIIFITGHGDIPMTVRAIKAGAIEFLTKPFRDQELLDAVQLGIERDRARRGDAAAISVLKDRLGTLTAREREILQLVVTGRPNKQLAAELGLSEITVKVHRASVLRKMQAKSLAELVRMVDRLGLGTEKTETT